MSVCAFLQAQLVETAGSRAQPQEGHGGYYNDELVLSEDDVILSREELSALSEAALL